MVPAIGAGRVTVAVIVALGNGFGRTVTVAGGSVTVARGWALAVPCWVTVTVTDGGAGLRYRRTALLTTTIRHSGEQRDDRHTGGGSAGSELAAADRAVRALRAECATAAFVTQYFQPVGAGGQDGSGRQPGGGRQPGSGGGGQPGGELNSCMDDPLPLRGTSVRLRSVLPGPQIRPKSRPRSRFRSDRSGGRPHRSWRDQSCLRTPRASEPRPNHDAPGRPDGSAFSSRCVATTTPLVTRLTTLPDTRTLGARPSCPWGEPWGACEGVQPCLSRRDWSGRSSYDVSCMGRRF